MPENVQQLKQRLDTAIEDVFINATWKTPRQQADASVWQAVQACHALHRAANAAYRQRCEREGIGAAIEPSQLPLVVFPEEIWKGYSESELPGGEKLGVFCERDVPRLFDYLNQYLVDPLRLEGVQRDYSAGTNFKGGLDRLRSDLLASQGVLLLTSSGTTGSALSLIPVERKSRDIRNRAIRMAFDEMTDIPGFGPIDPGRDYVITYGPEDGSMVMIVGMRDFMQSFGERAALTIPARVYTRELRWRAGVFSGAAAPLLSAVFAPLMGAGGKVTARKGMENTLAILKKAEASGLRILIFANQWMIYKTLQHMESLLAEEIRQGVKKPGDPYIRLAPGSVVVSGGGNKSTLTVPEVEVLALLHRVVGGVDRTIDGYGKAESMICTYRCAQGSYHLDPQMTFFKVDGYLAFFDPREPNKVPAQITGDLIDDIYETPCACGSPTRYFKTIQRDSQNRGSKGCAAALQEYAYR